jgi:hypothetical protein
LYFSNSKKSRFRLRKCSDKEVLLSFFKYYKEEKQKKIGEIFGFSLRNKFAIATYTHRIYVITCFTNLSLSKRVSLESLKNPAGYGVIKVTYILMTDSGEMRYLTK